MLFWQDRVSERAEGFIDVNVAQFGEGRWRAPVIDELELKIPAASHGTVRLGGEAALYKVDIDEWPLQFGERSFSNARRTPNVPSLDEQDHPLQESGQRQGICGVEKIPTVLRLALCGLGYIGGALLALLGFELSDYKWNRLSASLFGVGMLGAALGMGLLAVSAGCG
jgi:hypothetical protein